MYFDAYMNSFEKVPNALTYDSKHQRSKVSLEQRKSLIKQYSSASNNSQSNIKDKMLENTEKVISTSFCVCLHQKAGQSTQQI